VRAALVACFFLAVVSVAAAPRPQLLGRSVDGRPIQAIRVGDRSGTRVLVVGAVHGNETAGIAVARALAGLAPRGIDLWIVPDLNPDGVAAGTRQNAHGVDLNRNFPFRWRPQAGLYASGRRPLSEREARIAYRLIERLHPRLTVWFHQHLDLVWASGGDRSVERAFAHVSGLPYRALPPLSGSAIDWQNHALPGTTAFAAELPAGAPTAAEVGRYARAVLAAAHAAR
jgi:murein peptide amidase A